MQTVLWVHWKHDYVWLLHKLCDPWKNDMPLAYESAVRVLPTAVETLNKDNL